MMTQDEFLNELSKLRPNSTFLSLHHYRNASNEVADFSIVFHISYEAALKTSIQELTDMQLEGELELKARDELIESHNTSLNKMATTEVEDLDDGYQRFTDEDGNYIKGCKLCISTGELHIYGLVAHKRVIVPGVYKEKNKRALTIAKDKLRYQTRCGRFRQFVVAHDRVERIVVDSLTLNAPENIDDLIRYLAAMGDPASA